MPSRMKLAKTFVFQWRCGGGGSRGQSAPLTVKSLPKSGKRGRKSWKSRKKRKNREGSFTLPLLTDRAGYAAAVFLHNSAKFTGIFMIWNNISLLLKWVCLTSKNHFWVPWAIYFKMHIPFIIKVSIILR